MNLISRKQQKVSKKDADAFLAANTLPEQAMRFNQRHVGYLAQAMKDGLFRYGDIGIARMQGKQFQLNGQHTCHAISETSLSQECIVETWEVENMEEMSILYRQYDPTYGGRKLGHLLAFETIALLGKEFPAKVSNLIITALSLNDSSTMVMSTQQKTDLLKLHLEEARWLKKIVWVEPRPKFLLRGAVCSAMLRAWRVSRKDAERFWSDVRDGESLNRRDPQKLLRDFLLSSSVNSGRGSQNKNNVSQHEMIYKSIVAWNAFRRGEQLTILKHFPTKEIPKAV